MMNFKRTVQSMSLLCFILLLWRAGFPLVSHVPVDAFLNLDPIIFLGVGISTRSFTPFLWQAALILGFSTLFGRFFCSTLCPMGVTIDVADWMIRSERKKTEKIRHGALKYMKYQIVIFIIGAAFLGISFVFLASPLSLITRLYGLIIYPGLCFVSDSVLVTVRPLADHFDITGLAYAHIYKPRFDLQWFTVILFIGIFSLAALAPRFWCRNLCPSAAILALVSRRPLIRRKVSDECSKCGLCQKRCPMSAINDDYAVADHGECIVCMTCVHVCPEKAVSFTARNPNPGMPDQNFPDDRRRFIRAGALGMGAAFITLTSLRHLHGETMPGRTTTPAIIRPPGALPERAFLTRCIRCGECMKACPTNTLQPMALAAGFSAFFSPMMITRCGPCNPSCNVCGRVCPTGAIRALPMVEKIWAKMGTAHILKHKCLAWEFGKKCLICDEFCPYNAIEFKMVPGITVAVPFLNEARCSGCGLCEHNCPVQAQAAIVVEPMGSLRLTSGSFREKGRELGLNLSLKQRGANEFFHYQGKSSISGVGGTAPGFSE